MAYVRKKEDRPQEVLRVEGFLHLTRLETGLRRFLEQTLEESAGPRWWRSLPQDVQTKIAGGTLDGLDFPDLKKCIASQWRHLGALKECLEKDQAHVHLQEL